MNGAAGSSAGPGIVLVGGGVAAISVARRLRSLGYAGRLRLVSDENVAPYDRPPLSKQFLAGTLDVAGVRLCEPDEIDRLDLDLVSLKAQALCRSERQVLLTDGTRVTYEAVVLATGAHARQLPFRDLAGVFRLRTLDDAERLARKLRTAERLVVVGGGFIGLEVAATAHALGLDVTVLETAKQPLTRVLGPSAGAVVAALHDGRARLRFGVAVTGFTGEEQVRGVVVDGEEVLADVVVVGIGASPNTAWLDGSGLDVSDGVLCDDGGRTADPVVYAVGDVARWRHGVSNRAQRFEQWQTAIEQAAVVAANVAADMGVPGATPERWCSVPYFWSDQYEHKIQFCGAAGAVSHARDVRGGQVICFADDPEGTLTGVLAVDNPAALARGRRLVAAGTSWREALTWLEAL